MVFRISGSTDRYVRAPMTCSALDGVASKVRAARGEAICHEGDKSDACFRVVSGSACLSTHLLDGRRHVVDFLFAGDFFGFTTSHDYDCTAEAIEDCIVVRYPRSQVEAIAERDLAVCNVLRRAASAGLVAAQTRGVLLARFSAAEGLAAFFLWLADRRGGGDHLLLPMSRTDIGDYLGLTIETVSRMIGQFKARGLVRLVDTHHVYLQDRNGLAQLARGRLGDGRVLRTDRDLRAPSYSDCVFAELHG